MWKPTKIALILGIAGALAGLPSLTAAQQAAAAQKDPDAAGVAEAIRFQKAEQAAADRQARIEAREQASNSADRMAPQPKRPAKATRTAPASRKTPPPQPRNSQ
jgi:hypothetical protein